MHEDDFDEFRQLLDAVCGLLSRGTYQPNATNTALWFRSLAECSLDSVRAGFDAHVKDPQRGRFVPTPADILAQICGIADNDSRPGPEEAWALALKGKDEAATIVWTEEMAAAWNIAQPVMALGDEVGARMAFREAYSRLVDEARQARRPVQWAASLGFDAERRAEAVNAAVSAGRLPQSDRLAIQHTGAVMLEHSDNKNAREALRQLADAMRCKPEPVSEGQREHDHTAELKAASAEKVRRYRLEHPEAK